MNRSTQRASLGFALIAKDAAETLPLCLDSIRPYCEQIVVAVDETTTDKTAKVAKKHGADKVVTIQVADWHECPQHGRVLAQNFAKARQASWSHLDPNLKVWGWIDADDIQKNGEGLKPLVDRIVESPAVGAWEPYAYSTLNDGANINTLFDRERLCRTHTQDGMPIIWEWQHRVHEVIAPKNVPRPQWLMQKDVAIYHQEGRHSTVNSSTRNLLLLEIDLEENPQDHRAMFYLGNQYFALGNWAAAIYWYEQLGRIGKNHYELWQSWCYASLAYERLGNLDGATSAAYAALDIEPKHPEPYLRLASIASLAGEHEKCLYWSQQARTKEEPPFFVFKNPMDYTYNARMPLADSLAALGRVSEARVELEAAHAVMPNEKVGEAIGHYRDLEDSHARANAFLLLVQGFVDQEVIGTFERLELQPGVRQFGRVRDRVMPAYIRRRSTSQRRIIFFCGRSLEEWSPLSLTTTGIGGSETAVVEIAKRFARDDWRVDVYNGAGRFEGEYDKVGYWEPERLDQSDCDVWVTWRHPPMRPPVAYNKAIFWAHDLTYGPGNSEALREWDRDPYATICGVSQWHADWLARAYDLEHTDFVPNGIDLARFQNPVRKEAFKCVYGSSPDRGLDRLLALWPKVLEREPGVKLHIAYGWDNIDKLIGRNLRAYETNQGGRGDLANLKERCLKMIAELGDVVVDHGRMPQDELAALYSSASVLAYPTDFLEVSCITAMEAMAGGAVPVTSRVGALPETIGDAGILVAGMPSSRVWGDFYVACLLGVLTAPNLSKPLQIRARRRALDLTWDHSFARWKQVLGVESPNGVVETKEMVAVG